jgi:hypothetical protein
MAPRNSGDYPYESLEAVESLATKLNDICPSPESGAVVLSRSPLLDSKTIDYSANLPGNMRIIENSLGYIPNMHLGLETLSSSSYLFIRALKSLGAANIVLYMPAAPLGDGLPPVVAVEDHIDMLSRPPHIGVEPAGWEERFFPMKQAYDLERALGAMERAGLPKRHEILIGVALGQFDTQAGREAARRMGAGLISVHLFGQCLVARRAGMNVVGFAETAGVDPETIGLLVSRAL